MTCHEVIHSNHIILTKDRRLLCNTLVVVQGVRSVTNSYEFYTFTFKKKTRDNFGTFKTVGETFKFLHKFLGPEPWIECWNSSFFSWKWRFGISFRFIFTEFSRHAKSYKNKWPRVRMAADYFCSVVGFQFDPFGELLTHMQSIVSYCCSCGSFSVLVWKGFLAGFLASSPTLFPYSRSQAHHHYFPWPCQYMYIVYSHFTTPGETPRATFSIFLWVWRHVPQCFRQVKNLVIMLVWVTSDILKPASWNYMPLHVVVVLPHYGLCFLKWIRLQ